MMITYLSRVRESKTRRRVLPSLRIMGELSQPWEGTRHPKMPENLSVWAIKGSIGIVQK